MSEEQSVDAGDHVALTRQLAKAAQRPFGVVFRQPQEDEQKYPILARVVKAVLGLPEWDRGEHYAAKQVMARAIAKLTNSMTGRAPGEPITSQGRSSWRGKPDRDIAEVIFGYRDAVVPKLADDAADPEFEEHHQHDRYYFPYAMELAGFQNQSPKTKGRMLDVIREDIAYHLLMMEKTAAPPISMPPESLTPDEGKPSLIARPSVRRKLDAAMKNKLKVTWVYGEPGVGKTTAVESILNQAATSPVWLDCLDENRLHRQVVQLLEAKKIDTQGDSSALRLRLLESWNDVGAPSHMVIDNYDQSVFPEITEDRSYASRIIVISRYPPPTDLAATVVNVRDLTDSQALQLIHHYLPEDSDADCRDLAKALYNRALLLKQICMDIQESNDLTIREYLDWIATPGELVQFVDIPSDEQNQTIGGHYRFLLGRLAKEDASGLVLNFLDTFLCLRLPIETTALHDLWSEMRSSSFPTEPDLATDLLRAVGIKPNPRVRKEVDRALELLRRKGLLEDLRGGVSMHPLTSAVIIKLRESAHGQQYGEVIAGLNSRARRWGWQPWEALPIELFALADATFPSLLHALEKLQTQGQIAAPAADELQYAVALNAQVERQRFSGASEELLALITKTVRSDARKLVIWPLGEKPRPARVSVIDEDVLDAPIVTKAGLSALMAEVVALYSTDELPLTSKDFDDYAALGITLPTRAWRACKHGSLVFGIQRYVSEPELSACREAFARQSERATPVDDLTRREDQRLLLIYGRYLSSVGNVQEAVDVLVLNARDVATCGNMESKWIAAESLLICFDTVLRYSAHSDFVPDFGAKIIDVAGGLPKASEASSSRLELHDNGLIRRVNTLDSELYMRRLFDGTLQGNSGHPSNSALSNAMMAMATSTRYRRYRNDELEFELFDQLVRFNIIAEYLSAPDVLLSVKPKRRIQDVLPLVDRELRDSMVSKWQETGDVEHVRHLDFATRVEDILYQVIGPPIDGYAPTSNRSLQALASLIDNECNQLEDDSVDGYYVMRHRALAACVANLAGEPTNTTIVSRGIEAVQSFRSDWHSVIESVRDNPLMILRLLVR